MRTVSLYRIGSDPEALAVRLIKTGSKPTPQLINATVLVGENRDHTLQSFIGCDGHAATMELRPPPCHNVQWHLVKIADGLGHIRGALDNEAEAGGAPTALLAQPNLGRETCGGHIWVSLYYRSKLAEQMVHQAGVVYSPERGELLRSNQILPTTEERRWNTQRYRDLAANGDELSVELCWRKVHHLVGPLEEAVFGGARANRAAVVSDPFVRLPTSQATIDNPSLYREGMAYFRFEYRYPTTWLSHPTLALAYLGLAKLAILNWDALPNLNSMRAADHETTFTGAGKRSYWANLLHQRLTSLQATSGFRATPDLAGVPEAVAAVTRLKISYPLYVDFDAWLQYRPN